MRSVTKHPFSFWWNRHRNLVTGLFITWTLGTFAAQSLPPDSIFHEAVNRSIGPYLSATGTWIGSTSFFSPSPPKDSMQVEGRVYFADGKISSWISPEASGLSLYQKFVYTRGIKYIDNLYRDSGANTWPYFAHYLILRFDRPGVKATKVELIRRWRNAPPIDPEWWTTIQPWFGEVGYPHEFTFYSKDNP